MTSSANEAEQTKSDMNRMMLVKLSSRKKYLRQMIMTETGSNEVEAHKNLCTEADEEADPDAELGELKNQLLRVMADNENLRKRTEREVAAAKKYGPLSFARDLLASLDNLEKAISLNP